MSVAPPAGAATPLAPEAQRRPAASLTLRLMAGVAAIAVLAMLLAMLMVLRQSRIAVAGETFSAFDHARAALRFQLEAEPGNPQHVRDWAAALGSLRHVCIDIDAGERCPPADSSAVPGWFARAVRPPMQEQRFVLADGGSLRLRAEPGDELREAWDEVRGLLAMILAAGAATVLLVGASLRVALSPVQGLLAALRRAGEGDYRQRLQPQGSRELQDLAVGINAMSAALESSASEHRRLLQRGLQVQEDERRLLARELHDQIGQYLAALEADLAAASHAASAGERQRLQSAHEAARASVRHIFESVRELLDRLRPAALDDLGLAAALVQLGQDWQRRLPAVQVHLRVDETLEVADAHRAMQLYRIAQEGLTNAARHAHAGELLLGLARDQHGGLQLTVADNGCGFTPGHTRRGGLGLRGMRERAEALGGELVLSATPRRGCRIEVSVPA